MRDIQTTGFARMRVMNYTKEGAAFNVTVLGFPVFDSNTNDSAEGILTHYGTYMSDIEYMPEANLLNNTQHQHHNTEISDCNNYKDAMNIERNDSQEMRSKQQESKIQQFRNGPKFKISAEVCT